MALQLMLVIAAIKNRLYVHPLFSCSLFAAHATYASLLLTILGPFLFLKLILPYPNYDVRGLRLVVKMMVIVGGLSDWMHRGGHFCVQCTTAIAQKSCLMLCVIHKTGSFMYILWVIFIIFIAGGGAPQSFKMIAVSIGIRYTYVWDICLSFQIMPSTLYCPLFSFLLSIVWLIFAGMKVGARE